MMNDNNIIANILFQSKDIKRGSFIWNLLSATVNSFQTMILLFVLTHIGTATDSSIFVMAYAVGNLLYNISRFGIRQYQVTDAKETYSFRDYLHLRYFSSGVMVVSIVFYILYGVFFKNYTFEKSIVIILICLYKGIEAFEDVFHGRIQQKGRLDVAAKILFLRLIIFISGYIGIFFVTRNLVMTTWINVVITGILCVILNGSVWSRFKDQDNLITEGGWKRLFLSGLPLCLSALLNMYLDNAPKYIIDGVVSDEVQTGFNIIFMPVFVVSLLSTFIYQPHLKQVGDLWADRSIDQLLKLLYKLFIIPIVLDILIVIIGSLIGLPILEFIYAVPLKEYQTMFVVFLIAGGMIAVKNLYVMLLTTLRKQQMLFGGYLVSTVILFFGGKMVFHAYNLFGLVLFYFLMLVITNIFFAIISHIEIMRAKKSA